MTLRVTGCIIVATVTVGASACGDDGVPIEQTVVVAVAAQPCDRPIRGLGLGVVVAEGIVATAAHVVDGPRREVTVDGTAARVVAIDARTDLALLAADVGGSTAPTTLDALDHGTIRTLDGDRAVEVVRTGDLVVHHVTDDARYEREAHTFRPGVESGTSGAALVDDEGRLAGIVVLANRTDGTAYAVTAAELQRLIAAPPGSAAPPGCPG